MAFRIFTIIVLGWLVGCAASKDQGIPVKTVEKVDLQRYVGKWYEIGSFPMFFQRKCIGNTQANYAIKR